MADWTYDFGTEQPTLLRMVGVGPVEKVWLPDGSLFMSAGRLVQQGPNSQPALVPNVGHSGNVDGFCAALVP